MEHRVGLCSACGASFKVPASFSADRAKCKVCGGVVDIGPVRSAAGEQRSAAPPVPTRRSPAREPEPDAKPRKQREGPSMKERLLAERAASSAAKHPPTTPSAIPARAVERAVGRDSGRKPMQVSAAAASRAIADVPTGKVARGAERPVAGAAARTSSSGASEGGPKARGSKRGAASGARGRRGDPDSGEDSGRPGRGRSRPRPKQSPALLITAVGLVVLAAGAGLWYVLTGDPGGPPHDGEGATAQTEAPAEPRTDVQAAGVAAGSAQEPGDPTAASEEPAAPAEAERTPAAARPAAQRDPASVDLNALEEFGPDQGVDAEEWRRIRDLVATALDSESGISGSRAQRELEGLTRKAVPALINAMRHLDYGTEQGYRDGDVAQRVLQNIARGRNFGWYYSTEPVDHYRNKVVVRNWHGVWARARNDAAFWKEFAKLEDDEPSGGPEAVDPGAAGRRLTEDDLDDLDDL